MYPGPDVLEEVGRVTIAGSRLDIQMGILWHHLDRSVELDRARSESGSKQCQHIHRLAIEKLTGELREQVLAVTEMAEVARRARNDVVHQDWLLRGLDGMRTITELALVEPADLPKYLDEWERESKASQQWQRVPPRSTEVAPAQTLVDLRRTERALAKATNAASALTFRVASSRETGSPPGYVHPGVT